MAVDLGVEPEVHGGAGNGTLRDVLGLEREDDVGDAVVVDVLVAIFSAGAKFFH